MTRTKIIPKNYNINRGAYQLVLPLDLEVFIPEDDSVRLLSQVLEGLDYTLLLQAYSHKGRSPVVHPITMFKIIVYAYSNGIYSSRAIEKACRRDINFKWLLQGERVPDHNTISRFRNKRLTSCLENLFYQFVQKLHEFGEIQYKNVFIDGTKIEANANKYTFVWKKATTKFENSLKEKILSFVEKINNQYQKSFYLSQEVIKVEELEEILAFLNTVKEEQKITFVYGKGRRKTILQRQVESLEDFIQKQRKYDKYNSIFDGRNSFSKTDTDATFIHMKEDHMRNSQLKPGYNIQIGVEGEYIVGVDISSERSDQLTLIPFLEKLNHQLPKKFEKIVADAGYESEENYQYLDNNGYEAYIKPQMYDSMKKASFKKKIGKRENMLYDQEDDTYICHNGKKLNYIEDKKRRSKSGYISDIKVYECENCEGCPYKSQCTRSKANRKLYVSETFLKKREESLKNITSEEGILLRMNRSIQVEGTFGILKQDYGFRRFLTRGKNNVKVEFLLLSLGYNVNKLHNKIQNDKQGMLLHEKEIA